MLIFHILGTTFALIYCSRMSLNSVPVGHLLAYVFIGLRVPVSVHPSVISLVIEKT